MTEGSGDTAAGGAVPAGGTAPPDGDLPGASSDRSAGSDPAPSEKAFKRTLATLHFLATIVIAAFFIIMVMTATAQQEVLSRLQAAKVELGYSSAYAAKLQLDLRARLSVPERQSATRLRNRMADFESAWAAVEPLLRRAGATGRCPLVEPAASASSAFHARMGLWNDLLACRRENVLPDALAEQVDALGGEKSNLVLAAAALEEAMKDHAVREDALKDVDDALTSAEVSPDRNKILKSFSDVNILQDSWLLGRGAFIAFPPPMLQILLAFVSGLFGALLVTLVLIVYPSVKLDATATRETSARTLLGGLIALCVYIVLLGGTAVLGTNSGFDKAGANYMTFCAVGVLAGMFSDRVAYWLSERADIFFKRRGNG